MAFGAMLGKIPQQAVDLEEAVLGAILLESNALTVVIPILHEHSFYKNEHQVIYKAICSLFAKGHPVDILTVTQELKKTAELELCGGPAAISRLTNGVASTANIEFHARVISEKYIFRSVGVIANKMLHKSYDEQTDVFELLDEFNSEINTLLMENVKQDALPIRSLTGTLVREVEKRQNTAGFTVGIPVGISTIDSRLGGFKNSDLILFAGRPGMGKTAALLSAAINQAKRGVKVAIFSLEMSKEQLVYRLVSQETGIDLEDIMNKALDSSRLDAFNRALGVIESLPIWIDDTGALSVYDLRAKATRLKAQQGIEIVYVDYLQLCTLGTVSKKLVNNREREVSIISATLKQTAKELDIPFVALSQLSRQVETRGGSKRPQLSDLRDSGSLEQDANVVIFVHRPHYYGEETLFDGSPSEGFAEWIVAKNRNGSTGTYSCRWIKHLARFCDHYEGEFGWKPLSTTLVEHSDSRSESIKPNERFFDDDKNPF